MSEDNPAGEMVQKYTHVCDGHSKCVIVVFGDKTPCPVCELEDELKELKRKNELLLDVVRAVDVWLPGAWKFDGQSNLVSEKLEAAREGGAI